MGMLRHHESMKQNYLKYINAFSNIGIKLLNLYWKHFSNTIWSFVI